MAFLIGQAPKISEDKIDRMVKELKDRDEKRNTFSRRRRFHEEKDIDSINDRNEHFNKKIERAFGKYTLEIKNNLERGGLCGGKGSREAMDLQGVCNYVLPLP